METFVTDSSLPNISLAFSGESGVTSGRTTGDVILVYIKTALDYGVNIPLIVLSFMASVINVIAFSKMDRSEGVTQNLLILSIADTAYLIMGIPVRVLAMMLSLGYPGGARMSVINLINAFVSFTNCPLYVSHIVTTIIAVVRCCSIVMPLSFRSVFTARRQLALILSCNVIVAATLLYIVGVQNVLRFTFKANSTYSYINTDMWIKHSTLFDILRNALFFTCLATIVVSMVFLIIALRKSSQFQRTASSVNQTNSFSNVSTSKTSVTREAKVIKTVILILAIFTVCNVPPLALSILRLVFPEFNNVGRYRLGQSLLVTVAGVTLRLNVGLNFFVYYRYNSRFRQLVGAMFSLKKETGN